MPLYIQYLCHVIALSSINYNIKFTVHNKLESYIHRYESIMNIISTKDFYGYYSDMLYILQHFDSNFISFFIVFTVVFYNYSQTSLSRLL